MKHIVLLLSVVIMTASCSIDDPEVILIENAILTQVIPPDQLILGQTATFEVAYRTPTTCHTFERFITVEDGQTVSTRTETRFDGGRECEDTPEASGIESFEYLIESPDDYTFRFLRGASETGQLLYFDFQMEVETE